MAKSMVGSSILVIANEIRDLLARGVEVANMTVGDFDPCEFPIPERLRELLLEAVEEGDTNYPPPAGLTELRQAVRRHIARTQGLDYPLDGIAIVSGGRPSLYSTYRLLVDPDDLVVVPVPSWNNHNYRDTCRVRLRVVHCGPETAFQPTAELLRPHLAEARLLVLNTPQNPSGGVMAREEVEAFGRLLVEENERRRADGDKPLYLLYDQIYRSIVFSGHRHWSPVTLVPECAPYVIHSDGISKGLAGTGLRCGWLFGPPAIARKVVALLTHVGAWAPKPVQAATARLLADEQAMAAWEEEMIRRVQSRLDVLRDGLAELRADGLPVDFIDPQGAIYLSVRFGVAGRRTADGRVLRTNEDIRSWLLRRAAFAVVPFSAFGVEEEREDCWSRVSVGAVSVEQIRRALPRLRRALEELA
ncbi:MAG: aminotransferase class I/II-fold pyridoxal phosphate-dependent enzyme [Planctomycetota bacterium]|nr:MAG: aminotransferase class I/II-fold pyridoxal phosphate-dependent enzyme [Planctomycetota bacterium]